MAALTLATPATLPRGGPTVDVYGGRYYDAGADGTCVAVGVAAGGAAA